MKKISTVIIAVIICLSFVHTVPAKSAQEHEIALKKALLSNAVPMGEPLFVSSLSEETLITSDYIGRKELRPAAGDELPWFGGKTVSFKEHNLKNGSILVPSADSPAPLHLMYACFYLDNQRYQTVGIEVTTKLTFGLYIDGNEKLLKHPDDNSPGKIDCPLNRGNHVLLMKILCPTGASAPDTISVNITSRYENTLTAGTSHRRELTNYDDIRCTKSISDLAISPNGNLGAVVLSSRELGERPAKTYIELWDLKNRTLHYTLSMGSRTSSPVFSPGSNLLLFKSQGENGATIQLLNLETMQIRSVMFQAKDASGFTFSPDGKRVFFMAEAETSKKEDGGYVKYSELRDKLNDWHKNRAVFELTLATGGLRKLTNPGDYEVSSFTLSPDGTMMAYARMVPVLKRPFFGTEIWTQNIVTGTGQKIGELVTGFENSPLNLAFSPDGKRLAFTSAPDTVGDKTKAEHNVYNSDLFVMDLSSGRITKVTREFLPSLVERARKKSVIWNHEDGNIYFLATDRSRQQIFRSDPAGKDIENISSKLTATNVAFFSGISSNGSFLSSASSFLDPSAVYLHNTHRKSAERLTAPNKSFFSTISLGSVEDYSFTNTRGRKIDGWIFKPVGFDRSHKYPLIVYYYGGVAPRLETFSFAYHWLNANGYVVYVLNPSGAFGSGDSLADLNVDDWGTLASADIIQGTDKILGDKSYLDRNRVGAYGGSYGGFITMDLVTKTSLFAAVCSMYGISDLASYWGAGMWGFTYGDMAMARKYPWKDSDFFTKKSPLFNADKISTPILLLHGDSDVNVPPGESRELFTALRVLGRDAVLVEFAGEGHGIAGSTENYVNHREIMLEWFDKYLKGEGDAWQERWKE